MQAFKFYVFTNLMLFDTSGASGVKAFEYYVFTDLILFKTSGASGGTLFRCTTKECGERRVKGTSVPFNPLEFMLTVMPDVLWLYEFALVHLTRLRRRKVRSTSFLPAAKTAFTPLLLLSPPNPLTLGFGGDPVFCFGASLIPSPLRAAGASFAGVRSSFEELKNLPLWGRCRR